LNDTLFLYIFKRKFIKNFTLKKHKLNINSKTKILYNVDII
jgi:hypothetical protein